MGRLQAARHRGGIRDLLKGRSVDSREEGVRFRAGTLRGAIRDISSALGSDFLGLPSAPVGKVLEAYARDHYRAPRPEED